VAIRVVRLGSPRARGEGLRVGTVRFARRYRAEMERPAARHLLDLLAALSRGAHLSVGCYCEDERRCHRSVLRELLAEHGAEIV
jgi:uncharacterized protein YeaO (DUF488 family)